MTTSLFAPDWDELPDTLPIFPLAGVLLLPGGTLPLNIFERRYLHMVADALKTDTRMIGMIQPTGADDAAEDGAPGNGDDIAAVNGPGPEVYPVGCAGRIVSFAESGDGRYMITLDGMVRFAIAKELEPVRGYRRVRPDYSAYAGDMVPSPRELVDRDRMVAALGHYFKVNGIEPNWAAIKKMGDESLINFLAQGCPFDTSEKQALLEAEDAVARAEVLLTLLEMSSGPAGSAGSEGTRH